MKATVITVGLTGLILSLAASFRVSSIDLRANAEEQKGKAMRWETPNH